MPTTLWALLLLGGDRRSDSLQRNLSLLPFRYHVRVELLPVRPSLSGGGLRQSEISGVGEWLGVDRSIGGYYMRWMSRHSSTVKMAFTFEQVMLFAAVYRLQPARDRGC